MKNINNTQFSELVNKNSEAVIIDCRTESEWDEGRIKNAIPQKVRQIPQGQA